ncbi:MAG: SIS domain-containing protein [Sutterellaceae bacterium]|nr:SIS domain-containing protein [Sutterellaceae bacterium]
MTTEIEKIACVKASLTEAKSALNALLANEDAMANVARAAQLIVDSQKAGGAVYSCGNGGSLCDAMHFAEEMTGRYRSDRAPYRAAAISDVSHMACVGNDYGYEFVFSRWIESMGRAGDVLIAITTSGTSKNILAAAKAAKAKGVKVIGLTGRANSPIVELSDIAVVTPAGAWADRVQELHIKVIHILIELVERDLDPQNYKGA